jgi:hypothetical protein
VLALGALTRTSARTTFRVFLDRRHPFCLCGLITPISEQTGPGASRIATPTDGSPGPARTIFTLGPPRSVHRM